MRDRDDRPKARRSLSVADKRGRQPKVPTSDRRERVDKRRRSRSVLPSTGGRARTDTVLSHHRILSPRTIVRVRPIPSPVCGVGMPKTRLSWGPRFPGCIRMCPGRLLLPHCCHVAAETSARLYGRREDLACPKVESDRPAAVASFSYLLCYLFVGCFVLGSAASSPLLKVVRKSRQESKGRVMGHRSMSLAQVRPRRTLTVGSLRFPHERATSKARDFVLGWSASTMRLRCFARNALATSSADQVPRLSRTPTAAPCHLRRRGASRCQSWWLLGERSHGSVSGSTHRELRTWQACGRSKSTEPVSGW